MPPFSFRRPMVLASVAAVGAATVMIGGGTASASPSGTSGILTASNGSNSIRFAGGATLDSFVPITDAAWSPDGSRAVFVTDGGEIDSVRYDDGGNVFYVRDIESGVQRSEPSWRGDGGGLVFAAKPTGQPWRLEAQSSTYRSTSYQISPDDGYNYLHPDGGPDGKIVYQRQLDSTSQPDIGLYEAGTSTTVISNGSNPSISPDGGKIAFVRSDGANDQIWVQDIASGALTQVTANAAGHDNPTWSPTGDTIAFTQGSGVATAPADGSGAGSPVVVAGLSGVPSYQPRRTDRVARLAGSDRFTTATAVSQSHWATAGDAADTRQPAEAVVLSRSDTFADALSGSALAAAKQGPLLMTPPTTLWDATKAEIRRVLPAGKTVYLLGSSGAISAGVEDQIKSLGYTTVRLAGSDRFTTSIAIANAIDPNPAYILAATGMNFPDALAAGAAAGSYDLPGYGNTDHAVVLLTNDTTLPASTKSYLDAHSGAVVFGIGRQAYTATSAYNPIGVDGSNRYETALYTAETFFGGSYHVGVATGANWPDALAGGALMATLNGPLLLTQGDASEVSPETAMLLDEECGSIHTGMVFGAAAVVSTDQESAIGDWISGPGGYRAVANPTDIGTVSGSLAPSLAATAVSPEKPKPMPHVTNERVVSAN